MNSNSQSVNTTDTYSHRLADIVGTLIGLLTLTLPLFIIAHYSSNDADAVRQTVTYHVKSQ
ncbi:TLTLP motif-containing protein [Scytonema sp. NUACC21]